MKELEIINKDDIKVGDTVGIPKEVRIGWSSTFKYAKISKEIIQRITPAKTKFVTNRGEYDKHTMFYKYDAEAIRES